MSFDFVHSDNQRAVETIDDSYDTFGLRATWGETIVTTVAVSLAIMIVATVAILMGMA